MMTIVLASAGATSLTAQTRVLFGDSAAALFVYRGAPINPVCVARLLSRIPRGEALLLSTCASDTDSTFIQKTYQVLAVRGSDFLVASSIRDRNATSGANAVAWITRLDDGRLVYHTDHQFSLRSTSRFLCGGTTAEVVARSVGITRHGSTPDVLKLAGVFVDSATARRLREPIRPSEASGCDIAAYTYDLVQDLMLLNNVRLDVRRLDMLDTTGAGTPGRNPQGCFDLLVWELQRGRPLTLLPAALGDFGRRFAGRCLSARPGDPTVTWALLNTPPELGVPRAAWSAGIGRDSSSAGGISFGVVIDPGDHGPFSALVNGTIASVRVTWADTAVFRGDSLIAAAFVRDMLRRPGGSTSTFQVWSQLLGVPDLVAELKHVDGAPGRLFVWMSGSQRWLLVYQDGKGRWWFGSQGEITFG